MLLVCLFYCLFLLKLLIVFVAWSFVDHIVLEWGLVYMLVGLLLYFVTFGDCWFTVFCLFMAAC